MTNLTLVVLLLIPCVVSLLLLNCLFLGYKLLILSKKSRRKREDAEAMLLQSTLQRVRRVSDVAFPPLQGSGRRAYMSLSEPVLPHPVTSSRASSRERAGVEHRFRLLRPDGATGSGSLRAPSTIRATSPAAGFPPRLDLASGSRTYSVGKAGRCRSAPVFPHSSDSEEVTRVNLVPPNSPEVSVNRWRRARHGEAPWRGHLLICGLFMNSQIKRACYSTNMRLCRQVNCAQHHVPLLTLKAHSLCSSLMKWYPTFPVWGFYLMIGFVTF